MLFHVLITVDMPHNVDAEKIKQLGEREHERAAELQHEGKWLHLWRVAGKWSNVSIFKVDDPAELHSILESLPLYPFMDIEVTALCRHPGALSSEE
ncbi:MAG TPA: muconolactone Delta-isomerase family protein [Xanthobacteraceae bacterium]|jgi:muconolactone D-isomerase|nr:muconolactone Delta-isomerase family protein [Xanthobacteraceae bacterium]